MVYRQAAQFWESRSDTTKALVKAITIYAGISISGDVVGIDWGKEWDTSIDMVAPIASGWYLSSQLDNAVNSENVRDWAKTGIAALVGMDIAGELMRYDGTGSSDPLALIRNAYSYISSIGDKVTSAKLNISLKPEILGGVIGGLLGAGYQFSTNKNEILARRRHDANTHH